MGNLTHFAESACLLNLEIKKLPCSTFRFDLLERGFERGESLLRWRMGLRQS